MRGVNEWFGMSSCLLRQLGEVGLDVVLGEDVLAERAVGVRLPVAECSAPVAVGEQR